MTEIFRRLLFLPFLLLVLPACATPGGGSARMALYQDYAQNRESYTQAVVAMEVFVPDFEAGLFNDSASYRVDVTRNRDLLDKGLQRLLAGLTARGYRIGGDASYLSVGLSRRDGSYRVAATPDEMSVTREVLPLSPPPFYLGDALTVDADKRKALQITYSELPTYLRTAKEQGKPAELAPLLGTGALGEVLVLAVLRGADNYQPGNELAGRGSRGDAPRLDPSLTLDLLLIEMRSGMVVWAASERVEPSRVQAESGLTLIDRALKALP